MRVGMLWYDAQVGQPLPKRIERAAEYYERKYGGRPNLCVMHPTTAESANDTESVMKKLRVSDSVLPDHFWLGIEREPALT